jgi:hypothetical protein
MDAEFPIPKKGNRPHRHLFENPDSLQEFLLALPQTFGASTHHFKKFEALD